ncbi:Spore protein YkvP [Fundidesulfovibrio magnetotacticus]|uniref:Spore protein YkvP n=1 Tax=Fundidesulfovibrio magnetotacticus TaxID=2730080 RepID=A0A6V8LV05_9BACT|nr:glycosyltransferase [Fundidesulfovibrio magnetotacticus]GFK94148.1 Spore protein YkvP [Fundidesulfovibrio magnetotacticus]
MARRTASGFWEAVRRPRFRSPQPRALVLTSGYFLQREALSAMERLGWHALALSLPKGERASGAYVEALLEAAFTFQPDFALTVNHLGLDRQGEIMALFEKMALPLATWFVDSPRLILHDFPGQASPWCQAFSWDRDTLPFLTGAGFTDARWLPLGCDTGLFAPGAPGKAAWERDASFVGDSMAQPSTRLVKRLSRHSGAARAARAAAPDYAQAPERDAISFFRAGRPDLLALWESLDDTLARLDLEQLVTWEATRLYRLDCVKRLAPFAPLVAGDDGWRKLLPGGGFSFHPPLNYREELPGFYPRSKVNFNATSLQMKGAVNQRVFDVPACGGFLLTDRREQMDELFEPGKESATYADPGEIEDLARHFLAHPAERERVAQAARARVLAGHDYTHRLRTMLKVLRRRYA